MMTAQAGLYRPCSFYLAFLDPDLAWRKSSCPESANTRKGTWVEGEGERDVQVVSIVPAPTTLVILAEVPDAEEQK